MTGPPEDVQRPRQFGVMNVEPLFENGDQVVAQIEPVHGVGLVLGQLQVNPDIDRVLAVGVEPLDVDLHGVAGQASFGGRFEVQLVVVLSEQQGEVGGQFDSQSWSPKNSRPQLRRVPLLTASQRYEGHAAS